MDCPERHNNKKDQKENPYFVLIWLLLYINMDIKIVLLCKIAEFQTCKSKCD